MKILLLGATGLLGHNVVQQLINEGHTLVVPLRHHDALVPNTKDVNIIAVPDYSESIIMQAAMGCDAIINCAGVTNMSLLRREDYLAINRNLCKTLVNVMKIHGIKRLVHTSTVNTIGYGTVDNPADEERNMCEPFTQSLYATSKLEGEDIVLHEASMHPDWHVVVLNPGYMLGPMDSKPSSGRMLMMGFRKPLMFAPKGGKAFVDVRDVAAAAVSALVNGRNGQRYIITNSHGCLTIKELYILQAMTMRYRQRVLTLPNWVMTVAGRCGDLLRTLGIRTELSTCNMQQLNVREYYDNSLAIKELYLKESSIDQSIRNFYEWRNKR